MAWKYTQTASTSGLTGGLNAIEKRNQIQLARQEQNKQIQKDARQTQINKSLELWKGITDAGQLSSSDEFNARVKSDFLAPMINQYSEIVAGMNKGRIPVDIGTQALAQLDSNLNSYTTFVSYSNDVNEKYGSAVDIEPGKIGAIQTNSNNDLAALQFNKGLWSNPQGYNIVLDEKTNTPIMTDGQGNRINLNEWNDAMEAGEDFVKTIEDPSKLQETAITNMLGDMQNGGKISITDTRINRPDLDMKKVTQTTQSLYNFPAIVENINILNPFNNLTNDPSIAAGYWEGLGHEDMWTGSDDQIKTFNEEMNAQALDKFIPVNQRSTKDTYKDLATIQLGERPRTDTSGSGETSKQTPPLANYQPLISGNEQRVKTAAEIKKLEDQIDELGTSNPAETYKLKTKLGRLEAKRRDYEKQMTSFLDGFINRTIEMANTKATIKSYNLAYDPSKNSYMLTLIGENEDGEDLAINTAPFDLSDTEQLTTLEDLLDIRKGKISGTKSPY